MRSTEAIIIGKRPYGEADEIISALTKESGKLRLRARGIKKHRAKLAGSLQLLNRLEIYFVIGRGMPIATDAAAVENFPAIKKSGAKLQAAAIICSFVDRLLPVSSADWPDKHSGVDAALWEQFLNYLETLERDRGQENRFALAPALFVYQMLVFHGFRPTLAKCAVCGRVTGADERLSFSPSAGGVIDARCLDADPAAPPISAATRNLLTRWQTAPAEEILADPESFLKRRELARVIERFGEWHLGFPIELKL